ncbi:hypothetical protein GPECTOR_6g858 [Gonium pectorale]|uniref:Cyclic nucleotide-binding domain-containing protein n=1 Tax=Gonium pectorale TaxID=33097 RepID=A0A150GX42_GONPE|nr:hypothetical protein GPECTOR_6g858 [Gonium pectorale]|eukprot:KXZ53940.1 hypothetical protein GPECTOR_6g858 [Gonium pectorale]
MTSQLRTARALATGRAGPGSEDDDGEGTPVWRPPAFAAASAGAVAGGGGGGSFSSRRGRAAGNSLQRLAEGEAEAAGAMTGHGHSSLDMASSLSPSAAPDTSELESGHEAPHHSRHHHHDHHHHGHHHHHHHHPVFHSFRAHSQSLHARNSGGGGVAALLFPTRTGDDAPASPLHAPALPAPASPRGGAGDGGVPLGLAALELGSLSHGRGGDGGAPSLARESLRSTSMTERGAAERAETASVKHFKGIPPRLVEIYRQRSLSAHWSITSDPLLSRTASRRGSADLMTRPTGLLRQSLAHAAATAAAAAAATANGTANGTAGGGGQLTRLSMQHGKPYGGGDPGSGGGKSSASAYDDAAAFAVLDPTYDHPRMIGDDDEYDKPLSMHERLQLYTYGLIRPEGRTKWDLFILVLLVWVLFASPVIICFGLSGDAFHGDWVGIVELCVDLAFAFDIYLNFRTAYYDSKGHLVTERWRIARHYLRTWFLLDVICVIPYDLITAGTMGFLSMLKLLRVMRVGKVLRMIKMYRLLRVIRLPRILERMEMFIDRGVLQVAAFVLSVGLLAHLSACIFFYMAYLDGLGPNTWVAAYGVQDADLATKYLTSLYWAFTTTATVGYGDITPKTDKEKIIAIFVMCLGVSLVGYVTSSITNIMAIKNAQQTNIANKKQLVMDVLKTRSVPSELSRRVYNFFDYVRTYVFPADIEPWRIFEAVHKDELRHMPYSAEGRMKPRCLFGQAGVLHGGVWPATVIARNCCELYGIDRDGLEHMLAIQPELQDMLGLPRSAPPASAAHAASLVGPGANPLLPPTDRSVLAADFPVMDPAPQRGLMQSVWRSMGHMITGGLARASASHYPHMPGAGLATVLRSFSRFARGHSAAPGASAAGTGGGGGQPSEMARLLNGAADRSDAAAGGRV